MIKLQQHPKELKYEAMRMRLPAPQFTALMLLGMFFMSCTETQAPPAAPPETMPVRLLIDTDANNELDDQYALTYVLHNSDIFDLEGITVNRTYNGGDIDAHYEEAARILTLARRPDVPLYKGASATYSEILPDINKPDFDGHAAVDFIIARAHAEDERPLVLAPIGKLTNIALALAKDPSIATRIKILWLGSNWPAPGEYNLENDTTSVNPVVFSDAPFEMALVRYDMYSGTAAVILNEREVKEKLPGLGPRIDNPITGRHGGTFDNFGDYAVELFEKMGYENRALFDMAALALLKNPAWADRVEIAAPKLVDGQWVATGSPRQIVVWENFHTSQILKDFIETLEAVTD